MSRWEDVEGAVANCVAEFGGIDILINNAGVIDPISRLESSDPAGLGGGDRYQCEGCLLRVAGRLAAHAGGRGGGCGQCQLRRGGERVEGWSHYNASKAAVLSLTRTADSELGGAGPVRVVGLSPGTVATEMQVVIKASGVNPVSQLDPSVHIPSEWPAKAMVWLCSEDGAAFRGEDVSLRDEEIRRRAGLV